MTTPRFRRVAETQRPAITIEVDGVAVRALAGDTLMVAVLTNGGTLRRSEFADGPRAGFCLMGACQDCWMWTPDGERLRACTTSATDGLRVVTTQPPEASWPIPA
ncbi:(2Fe-2S)-binding protein [Aureimonas sp. AU12]|uniref:(2Fe-2S)-binding protein n=1 Tax=Aureimonas sp. AU12 TaxID=1638161 RepID=UPI000780E6CD|nr:(2Fe-2S)-binding protein [Aureimonas sp. AU12]